MNLRAAIPLSLLLLLAGCTTTPAPTANSKPPLDIQHAGLLVNEQGQAELGLSLHNISPQTLWVTVRFQTPDSAHDCALGSELAPNQESLFVCPQTSLQAGVNYPIAIHAYRNVDQTTARYTLETGLRFEAADIRAAGL